MSTPYSDNKTNKDHKKLENTNNLENSIHPNTQGNYFPLHFPYLTFNMPPNMQLQQNLFNYPINIGNKEALNVKENFCFNKYNYNSNAMMQNHNSSFNSNNLYIDISDFNNSINNINSSKVEANVNNNNTSNSKSNSNLNNINNNNTSNSKSNSNLNNINNDNLSNPTGTNNEGKIPIGKSKTDKKLINENNNIEININKIKSGFNNTDNNNNSNKIFEESNEQNTHNAFFRSYFPGYPMAGMFPPPYPHPFQIQNAQRTQIQNNTFPPYPPPYTPPYPPPYPVIQTSFNAHMQQQYEDFMKNNNKQHIHPHEFNFPAYTFLPPYFGYEKAFNPYLQSNNDTEKKNLIVFEKNNNKNINNDNENEYIKNNSKNNFNNEKATKLQEVGEEFENTINNYKIIKNSNESCRNLLNTEKVVENSKQMRSNFYNKNNNNTVLENENDLRFIGTQNNFFSVNNDKKNSGASSSNDFNCSSNKIILKGDVESDKNYSIANQTKSFPGEENFDNKCLKNLKKIMIDNNSSNNKVNKN